MTNETLRECRPKMRAFQAFVLVLGVVFALFSQGEAQKRVSVSSVTFDSAIADVQWAGKKHQTVIVKSKNGRVYRSEDSGKTWAPLMDQLIHSIKKKDGKSTGSVDLVIDTVRVNPVDKNIIMVSSTSFHHFVSENAGKSWRHIQVGTQQQNMPIHSWTWHPTKSTYALVSFWSDGCTDDITPPEEKPCTHVLHYTADLGRTFRMVQSYVVQFSWGDKSTHSEDKIFYTHHRTKKGDQVRYAGWSSTVDFSSMTLPSHTQKTLIQGGNKFLVSNGYIFVAKLTNAANQAVDLYVSTDGGKVFNDSILPFPLIERSYTILDTSGNAVMLHVNHGDEAKAGTGNIYVSDEAGLRFALSLPNNVRSAMGECEFDRVESMEGAYIANYREFFEGAEADTGEVPSGNQLGKKAQRKKYPSLTRTAITFDKGAVWQHLKSPKVDSTGNKISCNGMQGSYVDSTTGQESNCWLHLHGVTNMHNYAPFYSVENAVGLVMGTGNVGPYLRQEPEVTNTYLSRDGGLNWMEVHKGAYIYEFGDHGSLIVMADDLKKTSQVVFSWNEGQSWFDFDLGEDPIDVDNIIVEPDATSVQFLLYGTRGETGVLYHLDFSTLQQPTCKGVWAADSVSSDYELWTPTNGRAGEQCLMGKQVTYTRRKQAAECFNGETFERPVVKKNCQCSINDFECEFGFSRRIGSTECLPDNKRLFINEQCHPDGYRYVVGYRKIPGNTCEGEFTPPLVRVPCPEDKPAGFFITLFKWGFILALGYGLAHVVTTNVFGRTPQDTIKAAMDGTLAPPTSSLNAIKSAVTGLKARVIGAGSAQPSNGVKYTLANNKAVADPFEDDAEAMGVQRHNLHDEDDEDDNGLSAGVEMGAEFFDDDEMEQQRTRGLALELGASNLSARRPASPPRGGENADPLPTLAPPPKYTGPSLLDENFD